MENRVKTRLLRIFQDSLNSCKTKHLLDVAENAFLIPQNDRPPSHISSLCKPKHNPLEKTKPVNDVSSSIVPRRKLYSFLAEEGFKCPPASPLSPFLDPFYSSLPKKTTKKKKKKKERKRSQEANLVFRSYSEDSAYYNNWFSSDEEDDYSRSNTISSDSSERRCPRKGRRRRRRASTNTTTSTSGSSSRSSHNINIENVKKPLVGDLGTGDQSSVKDSFAVVKSSSDPRNDFMTSMVEMIIEKQILGADELEYLLHCFLSLNSDHHHGIIFQVFVEICEALFSS